jgi:lysozyme family protein
MTRQFDLIFEKIMKHEGFYSNHANDRGGQTYRGIARKFHPDWEGWTIIDKIMDENGNFSEASLPLSTTIDLDTKVREFYKQNYYDDFCGDSLPFAVAQEMFDISINMGLRRAVLFLQNSINALNRSGVQPDLVADGIFGNKTLAGVNEFLDKGNYMWLVKLLNIMQGYQYAEIAMNNADQRVFLRGWLKRVEINTDDF